MWSAYNCLIVSFDEIIREMGIFAATNYVPLISLGFPLIYLGVEDRSLKAAVEAPATTYAQLLADLWRCCLRATPYQYPAAIRSDFLNLKGQFSPAEQLVILLVSGAWRVCHATVQPHRIHRDARGHRLP